MSSIDTFIQHAFSKRQVRVSLKTAFIVGTILNLINQWQALFGAADIEWLKLFLTYLVPFCVATYAGAKGAMSCAGQSYPH